MFLFLTFSTFYKTFSAKMSSLATKNVITGVRGMKFLDPEKFRCKIKVPVLKVSASNLSVVIQIVRPLFLKLLNFKPTQDYDDNDVKYKKILYMAPDKVSAWQDIPERDREKLENEDITENNFSHEDLELGYSNFTYEEIFKAVLPENEEIVSGFSQIGHIIHLNLRDHLHEFRSLIGQVLVDKIKTCRTVVNKSSNIDNTYRNFQMEIIAGDEDFMVTVKENTCNFHFDFSKVYWNPRLCKEHERIISLFNPSDVLFDVFCGVGPFSVPAAKKKCHVFCNDLNPESYKWLNHNAKANKVNLTLFKSYNLDGKDFILTVFKDYLIKLLEDADNVEKKFKIHVTMNLPAMAVDFLKYFKGILTDQNFKSVFLPEIVVYVYCFVFGDNEEVAGKLAKETVIANIGCDISNDLTEVFNVRKVAPAKYMMRVSFKLTSEVLFYLDNLSCEPPCKKICSD